MGKRYLLVTADDFGIGPATSGGILDLANQRLITSAVLLVNSPHAEQSVRAWRQAGQPMELGWHPCLTLDAPILPPRQISTLVGKDGRLRSLGDFMCCWATGRLRAEHIAAELQAQYERFVELVGSTPSIVNSHQHVQIFQPVGRIINEILKKQTPPPYVRRIQEPWRMLISVPGARMKRTFLSLLGRGDARSQFQAGLPGNDWLAGVTNPRNVSDPNFLVRWLSRIPGAIVELSCHPGYYDETLLGRDSTGKDGLLERRVNEYQLLTLPSFRRICTEAGFTVIGPTDLMVSGCRGERHAA